MNDDDRVVRVVIEMRESERRTLKQRAAGLGLAMNRYLVGLHHGDLTRSLEQSELAQTLARTAPPPVDVPLPLSDTIDVPPPASELAELAAEPFERAIRFRMLVEPREARGQSSELEAGLEAELIAEEGERGEFGNES